MARVRSAWTPPSADGGGNVQAGVAFTPDVGIDVSGVWWYQRVGGPANVRASLWNSSGPTNLADSGSVSTAGFTTSAWNLISFGSPVSLSASGTYAAAILVNAVASVGYDPDDLISAITSADGHVTFPSTGGRFNTGTSFVYPASTWSGMHAVDIEYSLTSANNHAGSGTGSVVSGGSAAVILRLAAAASGSVVSGGSAALMSAGTTTRPFTGITTRPFTGTTLRP